MEIAVILIACFLVTIAQRIDSESYEYNGVEVSPFYETIIYSDIADIIKEFENNNVPFEKVNNDSESDENVEDLLSEYNHYLEKAHKQKVNFLEKSKLKNKIPVIRHEKFTKLKSAALDKHNEHHNKGFYNSGYKSAQALNPFNMFIPFSSNSYLTTSEQPAYRNGVGLFKKMVLSAENPISSFSSIPLKSPCCKDGRMSCKQCSVAANHIQSKYNSNNNALPSDEENKLNSPLYADPSDDTFNIRIKVDVQVPMQDHIQFYNNQNREKMVDYETGDSKESTIHLPSPHFNFPIPMNLFGYKRTSKANKHDASPLHKITIHKKKKTKLSNSNKKHRKKVITFHNINIEPQLPDTRVEPFNISDNAQNENVSKNSTVIINLQSNISQGVGQNFTTNVIDNANATENQTEENILLFVNITNNIENGTNEKHKTYNSIETEFKNVITNTTTDKTQHLLRKRETPRDQSTTTTKKVVTKKNALLHTKMNSSVTKLNKVKHNIKKVDSHLPSDTELLYWPNNISSKTKDISKNITAIILESENKKEKLNMSSETLRYNHTRVLEQAIFGNVNWNDVDSVAPPFISFFGKYIEGILTFCSEHICHSMKCTRKNCIHRVCAPKDRFNNKGHCTGSNITDSAASMESIMDLPSNVAFEIVDILQDRMIGKLYGKITLCINSKCITFAASKNIFYKNKCIVKDLSHKGHCIKSKEVKVA